jgi:single-strand DNA-binding protein
MNVLCIAGNLVKNPELRTIQSGKQVVSFTIAINEGKDKTEFVDCVAWEKTAELFSRYCEKGDKISCSGRIQTRSWDDKDSGQKRYKTEAIIHQFDFPPKKNSTEKTKPNTVPDHQAPLDDDLEDIVPF